MEKIVQKHLSRQVAEPELRAQFTSYEVTSPNTDTHSHTPTQNSEQFCVGAERLGAPTQNSPEFRRILSVCVCQMALRYEDGEIEDSSHHHRKERRKTAGGGESEGRGRRRSSSQNLPDLLTSSAGSSPSTSTSPTPAVSSASSPANSDTCSPVSSPSRSQQASPVPSDATANGTAAHEQETKTPLSP